MQTIKDYFYPHHETMSERLREHLHHAVDSASKNAGEMMEVAKECKNDFAKCYETFKEQAQIPRNVEIAIAVLLVFAGLIHIIPGPTLRKQARALEIPCWFIFLSGLIMMGSGFFYYGKPEQGIYAVSFCMGGAVVTAALMRDRFPKPFSVMSSILTFVAAVWANHFSKGPLTLLESVAVVVALIAGALARLVIPPCPCLVSTMAALGLGPDKGQICKCGNIFMDDSIFCRKCGAKRPQGQWSEKKKVSSEPSPAAAATSPATATGAGLASPKKTITPSTVGESSSARKRRNESPAPKAKAKST